MSEEDREELYEHLKTHKDIESYTDVSMMSVTTQYEEEEVDAYLYVIDDLEVSKEFFVYQDRVSKERYELTEEGIIISEKTADMLGADVGDTILLTEEGMNEHKVKITAICENYVNHYVYITQSLYEDIYEEKPFKNNVLIKADETLELSDVEKIGEQILTYDNILNVQYTESLVESLDGMLVALDQVMIFIILFAGLLSFIVLYNLNNINITERRRELATLKVLGFYNGEVAMYVYRENILLTLLGTLVGCGIGKFLHRFTIVTVEVDMAMFGRDISVQSYLICAAFTIVFSIIVNIFMYFKLKKINMVESLKSVE
jgi:putative ABC transport system permease protein